MSRRSTRTAAATAAAGVSTRTKLLSPKGYSTTVTANNPHKRNRDETENTNPNKRAATRSQIVEKMTSTRNSVAPEKTAKSARADPNQEKQNTIDSLTKENKRLKEQAKISLDRYTTLAQEVDDIKVELNSEKQRNIVLSRKLEDLGFDSVSLLAVAKAEAENTAVVQKEIEGRLSNLSSSLADRRADVERRLQEVKCLPDSRFGVKALSHTVPEMKQVAPEQQELLQKEIEQFENEVEDFEGVEVVDVEYADEEIVAYSGAEEENHSEEEKEAAAQETIDEEEVVCQPFEEQV